MSALTPREIEALHHALALAQRSRGFCEQVIRTHGAVRPFSRIGEAERLHIQALRRLLYLHALPLPAARFSPVVPQAAVATVAGACAIGVEQETARQHRLAQLLASTANDDLRALLRQMVRASELRHLPAYGRCGQCRNTATGGCPDGPSRPPSAPPRRCGARSHQDWLWDGQSE